MGVSLAQCLRNMQVCGRFMFRLIVEVWPDLLQVFLSYARGFEGALSSKFSAPPRRRNCFGYGNDLEVEDLL